ncbi:MAG TPA: DEAD/DEAH box helicase [Ornithinimicrobium sp.]|uniref:DEAD/DEAH box helicase n=1 Tax=Ornithinimicrobium sp. TaxID=1977084 RepID=UPI002B47604E|nr:DEAD/DEAH box helicase [Ornithinimicrobium sp.]HKJ12496.1 DEAD/DEAH box helicase [Ornithinimicrobium sp.]
MSEAAPLSPAQRYAASRERARRARTPAGEFAASLEFELDQFQVEAIDAVAAGSGVLVAAPTGAGKTIVGEFAVHVALQTGRKAFYTTPIKALSNQKYHDLVARYGPDRVGLLTGDSSVNGEAPVVVMTTEVLRNMMYAGSSTVSGLGFVVMDEVHYLADRFRGAVWEEVIIHLPESVQVVSLSATVSNAEEFGDWLATVRGNTEVIVSEHRPVPLWQHMMVGTELFDVFSSGSDVAGASQGQTVRLNPELLRRTERTERTRGWTREDAGAPRGRRPTRGRAGAGPRGNRSDEDAGGRPARPGRPPAHGAGRADVVHELDRQGLLPAITFIFSRAGCDAAVRQLLFAGVRLVGDDTARQVRTLVGERVSSLSQADLAVLGYHEFAEGLSRGFAAHHAGMLPLFREIVEELFSAGTVRAVFATETLALGINMPARSVVLEKLVKFNGEQHAPITPAEFTQLTGRAGRRGIDVEGHAVVLHRPGLNPADVAGLASTRTYPLRSSFRPSYNMAVNLVAQFGRDTAHELLQASFAQFQADRAVVGLSSQVRRNIEALEGYAEAMTCELGDFAEYARLRHQISTAQKAAAKRQSAHRRSAIAQSLADLRPGQVVHLSSGRRQGMAVVLRGAGRPSATPQPTVLTSDAQVRRVGVAELEEPLEPLATVRIPPRFNPRQAKSRRDLAATLRAQVPPGAERRGRRPRVAGSTGEDSDSSAEVARLTTALQTHPCHRCPQREDHARWSQRWWTLRRETDDLQRRIGSRTNTVARTFERICDLLAELDYLSLDGQKVTEPGQQLRRIYTEHDLVAAECLRAGTWQRLDPPSLAAVVSTLVHEPRSEETSEAVLPNVESTEAFHEMLAIWTRLQAREASHRLPSRREPDAGIAAMVYRWAAGRSLEEVLRGGDLSAGDFVRRCKQLVDLLGQIRQAAAGSASPKVGQVADRASTAVLRGVVAADRID